MTRTDPHVCFTLSRSVYLCTGALNRKMPEKKEQQIIFKKLVRKKNEHNSIVFGQTPFWPPPEGTSNVH